MAETKEELLEMLEKFDVKKIELSNISRNVDGFIISFYLNDLPFVYSEKELRYICFF